MSATRPDGGSERRFTTSAVVLAVVVGIVVFVVIPGYFATRPEFAQRFPDLSEEYGPWSESTHVEAACAGCHIAPTTFARTVYQTRMVGEFYISLVNRSRIPAVYEPPTNEACLECHSDLRTVSPKGDLQIPHRAHVTILEMDCIECHEYLVHEESPAGGHNPTMEGCLRCHDGDRAKNGCTDCHTEKAAPPSHSRDDWLIVHPDQADDPECVECHKWSENWCVECHNRRPESHAGDWRAVHGDRVAERRTCEACHEGEFCIRCHGDIPQLNYDPTLELVE